MVHALGGKGFGALGQGLSRRLNDGGIVGIALVAQGGHQIDWRWVKGHSGDPGNERADALANLGVDQALGRR